MGPVLIWLIDVGGKSDTEFFMDRRKFLKTSLAGAGVALTGCSGGQQDRVSMNADQSDLRQTAGL